MRLTHMTLSGFRRFAEKTTVRLDGSVIAVVGPNEAGKTTFLEALESLDSEDPLGADDPTRDLENAAPEIVAAFELDDDDRAAMGDIPGGVEVRRFTISKRISGPLSFRVEPHPNQDFMPRKSLGQIVDRLASNSILDRSRKNKQLKYEPSLLRRLLKWTDSDEDPMPQGFFSEVQETVSALQQALGQAQESEGEQRARIEEAIEKLNELLEHERSHPYGRCGAVLLKRRPRFLAFREPQRSLQTRYSLDDVVANPPPPLKNLAALAGLDLQILYQRIESGRLAQAFRMCEVASAKLEEVFAQSWVRADVVPVINTDGRELHVFVRTPGGDDLSRFDERSDGFRWFVALVAFVSGQEPRPSAPVLLVDEAETHLSYDAQANLAATLADQDVAQLVVYSTHSAGCLPPDLGTGIRAVIPEDQGERSSIENGFWHKGPGYTPLLLAMGASALAFTPARRVVVGEGASECILLPTLFREATGERRLSFQVAPGLSNVTKAAMRDVLSMAGELAYLVDGDEGGKALKENLQSLGFPKDRIVSYRDVGRLHVTLEDLVHSKTFTRAVNLELRRWQGEGPSVTVDEIPKLSRMAWLSEWCQDHELQDVSKPALAQRIVDLRSDEPVLNPSHRTRLARLLEALETALAG